MKKFLSKKGYVVYKVRREQLSLIGGLGICDECNVFTEYGYLVPVLNHYQCPICFAVWNNNHTFYPDDLLFQDHNCEYYESMIGLIDSFLLYVVKYSHSDFIKKSILDAAASRGGDLHDIYAFYFIELLDEFVECFSFPKEEEKFISSECKRLLKDYKEFYLD